jgi:hypothetical protein
MIIDEREQNAAIQSRKWRNRTIGVGKQDVNVFPIHLASLHVQFRISGKSRP